ncbi:hypothetical protein SteCoe_33535 [Stentor coeruleus]|uniref:DUF676 domain-containing protein n=1 Tax=Stentor coeruleus TaxID=5963 RepID=A0A1R2AWH8_9CILI|nr:hypothetical protein SteCoe_33535 [Stentor coeruleus]
MSLKSIVDIVIQLESFRNIDIYMQGLYYYEFKLYYTQSNLKIHGNPLSLYVADSLLPKHSINSPGYLDDIYFKSKTFQIRYCDEEIKIQEIVTFRIEIEESQTQSPELTIECSLMYNDSNILTKKNESKAFKKEASIEIKVQNFSKGIHQFIPITFDETHACVLNTTIHVIPLDYRFRPHINNDQIGDLNLYKSLSQFFFGDKLQIGYIDIIVVQNLYVKVLYNTYERIKRTIAQAINLENDELNIRKKFYNEELENFDRIHETDPENVAKFIMNQIQDIAGKLNALEYELINTILEYQDQMCISLMYKYNDLIKDRWGESIFRTVEEVDNFLNPAVENVGKKNKKVAKKIRKSEYYNELYMPPMYIKDYFPNPLVHPILFLDIVSKVPEVKMLWKSDWVNYRQSQGSNFHLIIFAHGFQGSSFDLRAIRNQIALFKSNTLLMCSSKNEDHTEEDIEKMGKRLAEEVVTFIDDWCAQTRISKISFIGHSLGGLIIRAALPYLSEYSGKFGFFMTFSSPHLGYMYKSSALVDAGMWFLKKFKKNYSMKQLTMTDSEVPEETFLYKLSQVHGLEWFKHIGLVSSFQDNYAPFESARIEISKEHLTDSKERIHFEMARNILSRITAEKIHRIDVNFKIEKKGIDSMIGRAAHIQMLDHRILMHMIIQCCAIFFEV